MNQKFNEQLQQELDEFKKAGTFKSFHHLQSPQGPIVTMDGKKDILVMSSNNYLGLADHPAVKNAGMEAIRKYGAGTGSVRFICGTFEVHRELERALAAWVGTESALTYVSCWAANEGLFPTIAGEGSVILSDEWNHASIIDAMRLSKAQRTIYKHADVADVQAKLKDYSKMNRRIVVTDGVFSMEGDIAPLPDLIKVCEETESILVVDDSHGTGVMGKTGRGIAEHFGVLGKIDVITSTLGKALGGAAGGFVAGSKVLIQYLEQKSRTQLFSNALPPTVAGSAQEALRQLKDNPDLVKRLQENTKWFREELKSAGFKPLEGDSAIVPVIIGETAKAIKLSQKLLEKGLFVTGFGYPVVPEGKARIRFQISAQHTRDQLSHAIQVLKEVY